MAGKSEIDVEAQYNNRAAVPDHPAVMARWTAEAGAVRRARPPVELAYGDRPREVMDLWEAGPTAPVAVFIHGGYWQALDRSWFSWIAPPLLAHGVSVAIPSYDLCPDVPLGQIIHQMRAVSDALADRSGRAPFAFGHSAGGQLAACLLSEGRTSAAMAISGVFDLEPLVGTSLNAALGLDVSMARALSPVNWPAPEGAMLDCVVGAAETDDFVRQSQDMAGLWAARGVKTRFEPLEGLNHFTVLDPLGDADGVLVKRIARLVKQ